MHNIYNKIILTKDGTLIDNWFEEGELRKKTGEGRTIRGTTFGKITFDPEVYHSNDNPHDDTYQRVIGEKEPRKDYSLTSKDYGQNNDEILQYTHPKLNVKDDKEKLNMSKMQICIKKKQKNVDKNSAVLKLLIKVYIHLNLLKNI